MLSDSSDVAAPMGLLVERLFRWGNDHGIPIDEWFNPGATEEQIHTVEAMHGVRFPDDYRAFLTITNGQKTHMGEAFRLLPWFCISTDYMLSGYPGWRETFVEGFEAVNADAVRGERGLTVDYDSRG